MYAVEKIIELLGKESYEKGKKIDPDFVSYPQERSSRGVFFDYYYSVYIPNDYRYYYIRVQTKNKKILGYSCSCRDFCMKNTCKHIAAVFIDNMDFYFPEPKSPLEISKTLLNNFVSKRTVTNNIKQCVKFIVELDLDRTPSFKLHVGDKRTYVLNSENKVSNFIEAVESGNEYKLGAKFIYSPDNYYFSKEDMELLNFFKSRNYTGNYYYRNNLLELNDRELIYLFDKLRNKEFKLKDYGNVNEIVDGIPTELKLSLDNDIYHLNILDFNNYDFVGMDFKYIYYKNKLYLVSEEYRKLLQLLRENEIEELVFDKNSINVFKDGLLKTIKNNILIDDNINDIVISSKPNISLYFDLNRDKINCDIKLDYKGNVISYFDKDDRIVRDEESENEVINRLLEYNFIIKDKKIVLSEIDDIGLFLSEGLDSLKDYKIYTTKKLDSMNIIKNTQVKSNFSIGRDGIMKYSFDTDNINLEELDKVFESLRSKKRYYKLKSGSLIDLENNDELNELNGIFKDLNLGDANTGSIEIPKYRAFYIDSLKNNKYGIIETDSSFNKFINNFKKYKDVDITFDENDNSILRDYQKDGVKWLYTLYKCDLGGILADEMGLGKSLQTICFIKQILKEKSDAKIMIVCPTSLVYNWKKEFEKFAPDLKYVVVHESKENRKEIINNFDNYNVFITSYGLIRNDNDEYEDKCFELCVIDEAQAIKNYQASMTKEIKKIKANTKIALTGTPLENSVLELWSIFDFIMPGYLNSIDKFRQLYGIKDVDDESMERIEKLNYQIKPFILRRKKKDVLESLPDKIENNIYLDLPDMQKSLYLQVLKSSEKEINELIETEGFSKARFKILQLLMKLRQICIDPNIRYSNYTGESVKFEKLLEIVKDNISDGHKILIFSSFKTVIDRVKSIFDKNNISSYMISGEVKSKDRMNLVDKFNSDDTNCFLITLKSGGTGLNLTSADVVIHLDIWWNPQVENQATDRAHRIGQKNKVSVIKLITKGTIEERIIELQNKKKILSDNLIEGKSNSETLSSLSEKDIRDLLSMGEDD